MEFIHSVFAVLKKDVMLESRSRYAVNTVLAFVAASTLVVIFALGTTLLDAELYSGLMWIIILFAAMAGLSRSFVMETEQQTFDLLRLHSSGTPVYTGKLIFNFVFTFAVSVLTALLFAVLTGAITGNPLLLLLVLFLGALGFSSVSTLLAALVSRADRKGAIFSVLCLPLLLPLVVLLGDATRLIVGGAGFSELAEPVSALIGYNGVTITLSILLFEYVWND